MEAKDGIMLVCPASCGKGMVYSRNHLRKTRILEWLCVSCGHNQIIDLNTRPELLADLLAVTIGDRKIDSRNIMIAMADGLTGGILLAFKDGGRMMIPTRRVDDDVETLESCGITVR